MQPTFTIDLDDVSQAGIGCLNCILATKLSQVLPQGLHASVNNPPHGDGYVIHVYGGSYLGNVITRKLPKSLAEVAAAWDEASFASPGDPRTSAKAAFISFVSGRTFHWPKDLISAVELVEKIRKEKN